IFGVFLNIGLNYFLIPAYLRNGAALATLITEVIVALIKIGKMKKLYVDYKILTKDRVLTVFVGVIISYGIYLKIGYIREFGNLITLLIIPVLYGITYFLILILLKNKRILSWLVFIKKRLHI
ncbi:MAG: polysaccharide biosynthesis C-terminal domain-containing protein, partial [Cetobacterium somerae]